jgi:hypothetical protein
MSPRFRITLLSTAIVALGSTALASQASAAPLILGHMCVITCDPNAHPGCTLCRGECSDENHTVGCYYDCTGSCPIEIM